MKRLLSLTLIAVLILSLIGCGTASNNTATTEKPAAETKTEAAPEAETKTETAVETKTDAPAGENIKLQFMGWEASVYETEANKACLQAYMDATPGVTVDYIAGPYSEHHTKLLTMMAGNAAPDVFYMDPPYYGKFIKNNMLLDVSDIFQAYYKEDDFVEWSHEKMKFDGKYYGIDSCIVGNILFYNKQLFADVGMEPPSADPNSSWSWDEFITNIQKLTVKDGDNVSQYGTFGFENFNSIEIYWVTEGISFFNADKTKFEVSDKAKAIEIMEKLRSIRSEYGASPEAAFLENIGMSPNQLLQTGKVALVNAGSYSMQELGKMGFEFGCAPLPKMTNTVTAVSCSYNIAGWTGTKYPDESKKLISYLASTDFQLPFVKDGLWMTNRRELYKPENLDKWFNPEVHPADFPKMTSIFEFAHVKPTTIANNGAEVMTICDEEAQKFFFQNQSAEDTLANLETRVTEALNQ